MNDTKRNGAHMESTEYLTEESFLRRATVELKRAERYHVFLSLICLDLSFLQEEDRSSINEVLDRLVETVTTELRVCDVASALHRGCLALLYPETSRDGAEVAAKRVAMTIRRELEAILGRPVPSVIPLEIASYPDAAGARTVTELLDVIAGSHRN